MMVGCGSGALEERIEALEKEALYVHYCVFEKSHNHEGSSIISRPNNIKKVCYVETGNGGDWHDISPFRRKK